MKLQMQTLLRLLLLAALFSACNFMNSAGGTTPGIEMTVSPAPDTAVSTSAPPTPTSTTPAPTQTPDPNAKVVKFDNVSFAIPSSVALAATAKVIPAVTTINKRPWLVAPQYVHFALSGYGAPKGSYVKPEIFVYPAQDYAANNFGANTSIQRLKTILADPSTPLNNTSLPWLPYTPGEQSIAAQPKIVSFKSGSGVRALTQYDIFLDPVVTVPGDPIVNRLFFYHFEGLSSDGKTYIIATLPLESAILANDPDPNAPVPAGGIPYPGLGTDMAHFNYFKAVTDQLNAQSEDSFQPSLNLLDALISSIEISP